MGSNGKRNRDNALKFPLIRIIMKKTCLLLHNVNSNIIMMNAHI